MRHASLFSGIGGPEVAAAMLGWENVFHCEINEFGRKVLEYWFPNSESYEDITKTDFRKFRGPIDVLTGGFPCQPFSYAGKRGGQQDQRYLWPEMLRVINEVRPTWVIGENVAGIGTMVEQCRITDLGSEATLFEKGGGLHRYTAEYTFTIERICSDLESKGYSVQPMLIPACAVGAPHRRDRIFFIAHYTDSCNDLRESGQHESESGKERLSERNEVRKPGESSDVRSEMQSSFTDTECLRLQHNMVGRGETRMSEAQSRRGKRSISEQVQFVEAASKGEFIADSDLQRCNKSKFAKESRNKARFSCEKNIEGGFGNLHPKERWASFPTVSAVHRGNDGIPFDVDKLAISIGKWRTESIKAYGNAIVPQVMYRIFEAIEALENDKAL
jgi:DNA (cytosine-5)-methyltransferase 1